MWGCYRCAACVCVGRAGEGGHCGLWVGLSCYSFTSHHAWIRAVGRKKDERGGERGLDLTAILSVQRWKLKQIPKQIKEPPHFMTLFTNTVHVCCLPLYSIILENTTMSSVRLGSIRPSDRHGECAFQVLINSDGLFSFQLISQETISLLLF